MALAFAYATLAGIAAFTPLFAAVFGGLALPFAVQLLPAFIGLCFVRWISRAAIIAGLVFGLLLVTFTEPLGLILFEGLFLDLPWGRWPLTIHSAAWGLAFNVAVVLLASIFTARGTERVHRDRLHDEFAARWSVPQGRGNGQTALWSLTLSGPSLRWAGRHPWKQLLLRPDLHRIPSRTWPSFALGLADPVLADRLRARVWWLATAPALDRPMLRPSARSTCLIPR